MAAYVNHKSYEEHPAYTRDFDDKVRSGDKASLLTHIKLMAVRGDPENLDETMKFRKKDATGHDKPITDGYYSTVVYLRILLDEQNNTPENRQRWAQDLANIISVVCEHGQSNNRHQPWLVKVQQDRTAVPMRHIGDLITTDSAFTVMINLYEDSSFEDLVNNDEAMKVVFGEKRYKHARARYEGSKTNFASNQEDKGKVVDDKIQALGISSEEL